MLPRLKIKLESNTTWIFDVRVWRYYRWLSKYRKVRVDGVDSLVEEKLEPDLAYAWLCL